MWTNIQENPKFPMSHYKHWLLCNLAAAYFPRPYLYLHTDPCTSNKLISCEDDMIIPFVPYWKVLILVVNSAALCEQSQSALRSINHLFSVFAPAPILRIAEGFWAHHNLSQVEKKCDIVLLMLEAGVDTLHFNGKPHFSTILVFCLRFPRPTRCHVWQDHQALG